MNAREVGEPYWSLSGLSLHAVLAATCIVAHFSLWKKTLPNELIPEISEFITTYSLGVVQSEGPAH